VPRIRYWTARILFILSILGPGFITANVDNDSGGIFTYSSAGAQFGYSLLWTMIPMAIALAIAQELAARTGVVTGKGLSELIREEYGLRTTFLLMAALVACNLGDVISEFVGVASSLQLFGISKFISVPIAAALVWLLVVFGDYKRLEKIFVFLSFLYIAYIITGILAKPNWLEVSHHLVTVPSLHELRHPGYLYLAVGIIGATIAPWQQFYLQASIVEKGSSPKDLKYSQIDAVFGSLFSVIVAGFIIIVCAATLYTHGHRQVSDAADAGKKEQDQAKRLKDQSGIDVQIHGPTMVQQFFLSALEGHGRSLQPRLVCGRNAAGIRNCCSTLHGYFPPCDGSAGDRESSAK